MKIRVILVMLVFMALVDGFGCWLFNPPLPDEAKPVAMAANSASPAPAPKAAATIASSPSYTSSAAAQGQPASQSSARTISAPSGRAASATSESQGMAATGAKGFHFPTPADTTTAYATSSLAMVSQRRRLPVEGLTLDSPLAVYDLNRILAEGGSLNDAVFSGTYLYPVDSDGQTVDGFGVRSPGPNGPSLFEPSVNYAQISAGLQYLAGLGQVQAGSYEVRFVMAGNTSNAIWLKSENGSDDLFYTISGRYPSARDPIQGGVLMSANDYVATVGSLVQKAQITLRNSPFYSNRGGGGQ